MKKFILFLSILMVSICHGQIIKNSDIVAPNPAELGEYGQIPVSFYNGLPQIHIPLYTVVCQDLELPISLSYHAGGNKTEDHPSWVGLGWNLSAGGAISRITNGVRDELGESNWMEETHTGGSPSSDWSYYLGQGFPLINWYSVPFVQNIFNHHQVTGSGEDTQPDEFVFNFLDYSGSFFFVNENGHITFKFKSKNNAKFKVEVELADGNIQFDFFKQNPEPDNDNMYLQAQAYRTFQKIVLTDMNGIRYEFGGDPENNIDFTTSNNITVATTWHLSKIISPNGSEISLSYKSDGDLIRKNKSCYLHGDVNINNQNDGNRQENCTHINGLSISIIHPKYLQYITTSENQNIEFVTSISSDLDYDDWITDENAIKTVFRSVLNPNINVDFIGWDSKYLDSHYSLKLDQIILSPIKKIGFKYIEELNQRLKLDELLIADYNSDMINDPAIQKYSFEYNDLLLPNYNKRKSDNWGYFNNIDYSSIPLSGEIGYQNTMFNTRQPDEEYMKAEILEKIQYPTGGVSVFEYGINDYSKIVQPLEAGNYAFQLVNQNGEVGGLRIESIISYPDMTDMTKFTKKTFSYTNIDGSSSGILSGKPQYYIDGLLHTDIHYSDWWDFLFYYTGNLDIWRKFYQYSQVPILPLSSTNGSHITYSRVTVKEENDSYTVYSYTNHEDYPDEVPLIVYTNNDGYYLNGDFTSREIERGLLKSVENYDDENRLLEKVEYTYNQDPNRYLNFVKKIDKHFFYNEFRFSANKIYTFTPYLIQKNQKVYYYNNSVTFLENITNYKYNEITNLLEEMELNSNSDGAIIKDIYRYPNDYPSNCEEVYHCSENLDLCLQSAEDLDFNRRTNCSNTYPPYSTEWYDCMSYAEQQHLLDIESCNSQYVSCKVPDQNRNDAILAIDELKNKNMFNTLIETNQKVNDKIVEGKVFEYKIVSSNLVLPYKSYVFSSNEPLLSNNLSQSAQDIASFQISHCELTDIYNEWSTNANIKEIKRNNGIFESLIWGYNQKYIVSKTIGARVTESGYTGFENNESNSFDKTSNSSYNTSEFITGKASLFVPSGNGASKYFSLGDEANKHSGYMATVWAKGNSAYLRIQVGDDASTLQSDAVTANDTDWHLLKVEIPRAKYNNLTNPQIKVYIGTSGSNAYFDDLRFHPMDAQMTSYTHKPLIGITSSSDANNKPTYFDYDALGRLNIVKNFEGNILKKHDYHYRPQ